MCKGLLFDIVFAIGLISSLLGEELDAFLKRHVSEFDQVIYVGDGSNDFCPVLRLRA